MLLHRNDWRKGKSRKSAKMRIQYRITAQYYFHLASFTSSTSSTSFFTHHFPSIIFQRVERKNAEKRNYDFPSNFAVSHIETYSLSDILLLLHHQQAQKGKQVNFNIGLALHGKLLALMFPVKQQYNSSEPPFPQQVQHLPSECTRNLFKFFSTES